MPYDRWKETLAPFIASAYLKDGHPDELNSPEMERCFTEGSFIPSIPAYWTGMDDEPSPDKDIPTAWLRVASLLRIVVPESSDIDYASPLKDPGREYIYKFHEGLAKSRRAADTLSRFLKGRNNHSSIKRVHVQAKACKNGSGIQLMPQLNLLFMLTAERDILLSLYAVDGKSSDQLQILDIDGKRIWPWFDFLRKLKLLHHFVQTNDGKYPFRHFYIHLHRLFGLAITISNNGKEDTYYSCEYPYRLIDLGDQASHSLPD